MVFGTTINGSRLWIELPGGQTIQLTELSKVLIVIFLAGYLRDKRELLAIPTRRIGRLPVPPIAALGPAILVLARVTRVGCAGLFHDRCRTAGQGGV